MVFLFSLINTNEIEKEIKLFHDVYFKSFNEPERNVNELGNLFGFCVRPKRSKKKSIAPFHSMSFLGQKRDKLSHERLSSKFFNERELIQNRLAIFLAFNTDLVKRVKELHISFFIACLLRPKKR